MAFSWKTPLLEAYRRITSPYRTWFMQRACKHNRAPILILYYHRVADVDPVPWSLTNVQFQRHLDWLTARFDMISIAEAQRRMRCGVNSRPAAHITFDDGYAENYQHALPMLLRRGIPFTYFVTLQNITTAEPFRHDVQLGKRFPVNSISELRELSSSGVEIGAHTRTHPNLGKITDQDELYDEVVIAREELQEALGAAVRYFAFPFGMHENLNPLAFHLARESGVEAVCSAYGGYNFPDDDAFHLQRAHGDPELARLKNVATMDPRHLHITRFDYSAGLSSVTTRQPVAAM